MGKYNEQVFYKKTVLKNFTIITEKHLCWSLFLNKSAGLQSWNIIKKWFQHRCFPVNTGLWHFQESLFLKISQSTIFNRQSTTMKNIFKRLFERFATWSINITSNRKWRRHFFKTNSITSNGKRRKTFLSARWKKLAFTWCSWSFRFSLFLHCMSKAAFPLHNKRW